MLDLTISLMRSGQTGNGHDELSDAIETMRTSVCPDQWDVFNDYSSEKTMAEQFGLDPCANPYAHNIEPDAIQLLREDGFCTGRSRSPLLSSTRPLPSGGIAWRDAAHKVGTNQRICGPLVSIRNSNDDVFLNLGYDYPDPGRFTIVIWDIGALEPIPSGTTVCTTGVISLFDGVLQIELRSASDVELYY